MVEVTQEATGTGGQLLVDLGNSRVKWAWLAGRTLHRHGSAPWSEVVPADFPATPRPTRVLYLPMTRPEGNRALEIAVRRRWRLRAEPCRAEAQRDGLANGYAEAARLGADRWSAMLAAWHRVRGAVCVIDAGTALTVDCVDAAGLHQAGYLHPGVAALRGVLATSTGVQAGVCNAPTPPQLHGRLDTAACLAAALQFALAGLVQGAWQRFHAMEPRARLFLTGGDAAYLASHLTGLPIEMHPHLVLEGLAARVEAP